MFEGFGSNVQNIQNNLDRLRSNQRVSGKSLQRATGLSNLGHEGVDLGMACTDTCLEAGRILRKTWGNMLDISIIGS